MSWEWTILYGLQGIHQAWLDKLMVFITHFATGGAFWICLGLLFYFGKKVGRWVFVSSWPWP